MFFGGTCSCHSAGARLGRSLSISAAVPYIKDIEDAERHAAVAAKTAYIMPGSPWENGYCETFNSNLRDELLNGEIFYTLKEAKIIIEQWRRHYNTIRPHSSLGYKPPAPEAVQWPATQPGPATPATPAIAPRPIIN